MSNRSRQSSSAASLIRIGTLIAVVLLIAAVGAVWWAEFDSDSEPSRADQASMTEQALLSGIATSVAPNPSTAEEISLTEQAEQPSFVDLAAPFDPALGDTGPLLHLRAQPAAPGANALAVFVTEPTDQPGQEPVRRPLAPELAVELTLTSLNHELAPVTTTGQPDAAGGFTVSGLDLAGDGWWRVDLRIGPPNAPEVSQNFLLMLPDPNVHGSAAADAVATAVDGGEAAAIFNGGLTALTGLHRLRYEERLADGNGHLVIGDYALSDGTDGRPPALSIHSARTALIRIGDREWLRRGDGQWSERTSASEFVPADFADTYAGATDLRLGRTEEIEGEPCRIVTFYVPEAPRRAEAWYAWWVGVDSSFVRQEAMVANSHYMIHRFGDFDAEFAILPPDPTGAGTGTPQPGNGTPDLAHDSQPAGATTAPPTTAYRTTSRHKSFTVRG